MKTRRGRRAANRHEWRRARSRPSTYIKHFEEAPPDVPVVLWCRVTTTPQANKGNLTDQDSNLRAAVEKHGGPVVGTRSYVGQPYAAGAYDTLIEASLLAEKAGAVLLAETTSRFARHPDDYPSKPNSYVAGLQALSDLRLACGDVPLYTLVRPDAPLREERKHQAKRGQGQKGNKGGRPKKPKPGDKKRENEPKKREAVRLWQEGMRKRAIGRVLRTNESNVRRWVRHFTGTGQKKSCD